MCKAEVAFFIARAFINVSIIYTKCVRLCVCMCVSVLKFYFLNINYSINIL